MIQTAAVITIPIRPRSLVVIFMISGWTKYATINAGTANALLVLSTAARCDVVNPLLFGITHLPPAKQTVCLDNLTMHNL
jgi:hypothetical protein